MVRYIAGDIGGTNSRLQLWEQSANQTEKLIAEKTYPSQQYTSLTLILIDFLSLHNPSPVHPPPFACALAVAGPVSNNFSTITNVSWTIDGSEISKTLKICHVVVINDFVGIGFGLLALEKSDFTTIYSPAKPLPASVTARAPKACIGAGTGLGEAYLTCPPNSVDYNVWSSEGAHTDFSPRNELEFEILQDLLTGRSSPQKQKLDRVSVERVVSGMGIPALYSTISRLHPSKVNPTVAKRILSGSADPGAEISKASSKGECEACKLTMDKFVELYGAETGNLALKTLPLGGIYIAGGIALKIQDVLKRNDNQFVRNYLAKGRMKKVLEQIPIHLVTHPQVGLLGSQVVCKRLIRDGQEKAKLNSKL